MATTTEPKPDPKADSAGVVIHFRVSPAVIKRMDRLAKEKMVSRSTVARWALVKYTEGGK